MKNKKNIFIIIIFIVIIISATCIIVQKNNDIEELKAEIETLREEIAETNTSTNTTNSTGKSESYAEYKKRRLSEIANETENVVYKTKSGTKYHRSTCRHLNKSKISISKEKAIQQGLEPCSTCNP